MWGGIMGDGFTTFEEFVEYMRGSTFTIDLDCNILNDELF